MWPALLAAALAPMGPTAAPLAVGKVYEYHAGVMATVARNRGMALDWTADGFASVRSCAWVDAGHPWYVWATVAGRLEKLQIIDCSDWDRDGVHQLQLDLVLEVDHATAHRGGWAVYGGDRGPGHSVATLWRFTQEAP